MIRTGITKKKIYVKVFVTVHMYVCIAYKRVIAMKFDVKPGDLLKYSFLFKC